MTDVTSDNVWVQEENEARLEHANFERTMNDAIDALRRAIRESKDRMEEKIDLAVEMLEEDLRTEAKKK
jgi:hypothetical protein